MTDALILMIFIVCAGAALYLVGTGAGQVMHRYSSPREPRPRESWGMKNYGTDDPKTIYRMQFQRSTRATVHRYRMAACEAQSDSERDFCNKIADAIEANAQKEMAAWE